MLITRTAANKKFWFVMRPSHLLIVSLLFTFCASTASAQKCPAPDNAQYPPTPLTYPMSSDQYTVQYSVNGGTWTDARVYISIYGGTNSSPYEPYTNYLPFTSYS